VRRRRAPVLLVAVAVGAVVALVLGDRRFGSVE
jgi:hypothetical protein